MNTSISLSRSMESNQLGDVAPLSFNREEIVGKIRGNLGTDIGKQQCEWIKQWILEPSTTDHQIQGLLNFWIGSSCIDKLSELSVLEGEFLFPGLSDFFAKILYVADRELEQGDFNNTSAEGFYKVLNKVSEENKSPGEDFVRGSAVPAWTAAAGDTGSGDTGSGDRWNSSCILL